MSTASADAELELFRRSVNCADVLVGATDANAVGDCYAAQHAALTADAALRFERLRPPEAQDRNDVLVTRRA